MNNKNANVQEHMGYQAESNGVRKGAAFGLALGLAALVALPGLASASGDRAGSGADQGYQLSYNVSELKSLGSAKTLHRRIRRVALAHCPNYGVTKDLRDRAACIEEVEADLVSKVNHPLLTQVHTGNSVMNVAGTDR